jgi:hypothetical protein
VKLSVRSGRRSLGSASGRATRGAASLTKTFARRLAPGRYLVTLTVPDGRGGTRAVTATVVVT